MAESSADAIRLRRALDTLPQGVIVCDENGEVVFRNARAVGLMGGRHGDALAAQAVVELLADAWKQGRPNAPSISTDRPGGPWPCARSSSTTAGAPWA